MSRTSRIRRYRYSPRIYETYFTYEHVRRLRTLILIALFKKFHYEYFGTGGGGGGEGEDILSGNIRSTCLAISRCFSVNAENDEFEFRIISAAAAAVNYNL